MIAAATSVSLVNTFMIATFCAVSSAYVVARFPERKAEADLVYQCINSSDISFSEITYATHLQLQDVQCNLSLHARHSLS